MLTILASILVWAFSKFCLRLGHALPQLFAFLHGDRRL